jgi:gas vesicle protein
MDSQTNQYEIEGKYRSSGGVSLAITMLFIGLAVGSVTALLLAPKTGRQMRRTLRRKYENARDTMDDIKDQAGDWLEKGSEWAEKAKSRVAPFRKPSRA